MLRIQIAYGICDPGLYLLTMNSGIAKQLRVSFNVKVKQNSPPFSPFSLGTHTEASNPFSRNPMAVCAIGAPRRV